MASRFQFPFHPIESTAPSFEVTFDNTSTTVFLESTGLREWGSPLGRVVRFATRTADDYLVSFGSSLAVAASSDSMLLLGGTVEVINLTRPSVNSIALQSSTDVVLNVTLGFGA